MKKKTEIKEETTAPEAVTKAEKTDLETAEPAVEAETAAASDAALTAPAAPEKVYGDKVLTKAQKKQRIAIQWALMIFGIIMMSCSVYFFQTPNNFTLGGIAGVAIVINKLIESASPEVAAILTQGVLMAIINVALLIIGLIILGKQCTFKTIFCSLFYTGFIYLFEKLNIIGLISETGTLTSQPILELVYAILLFGIGGALVFNCGASSGGTDIIALILKKYTSLNVGMALMIIDMIVV